MCQCFATLCWFEYFRCVFFPLSIFAYVYNAYVDTGMLYMYEFDVHFTCEKRYLFHLLPNKMCICAAQFSSIFLPFLRFFYFRSFFGSCCCHRLHCFRRCRRCGGGYCCCFCFSLSLFTCFATHLRFTLSFVGARKRKRFVVDCWQNNKHKWKSSKV